MRYFGFLAEVNALSTDDGPLHWLAVFPSLVPVSVLLCSGIAEDCRVFRLIASGLGKVSFETRLFVPGTVLKKTSEYFVQWRDLEKGGMWGLNFMSEDDALQFLDVCSMPQYQHSKLVQTPSTMSLYGPVPPQAQLSDAGCKQTKCHQVRQPSPMPEFGSGQYTDPDEILSISSGASQFDPTVPRDFIAGLDPPKSSRASKIGFFVGRQLEAAIFSQLEESAVDSDTEDANKETSSEASETAESQASETYGVMMAKVHSQHINLEDKTCMQTTSVDGVQDGLISGTSFEQPKVYPVVVPEKQPGINMTDVDYQNGSHNVESYFNQIQPLPAVSVTADWIPIPKQAVLVNCLAEVEITRTVSNVPFSTPQLSEGTAESPMSTVTVLSTESQSLQGNSTSYISDIDEVKTWAPDAQVNEDWLRLNHDSVRLTDSGFTSPSTPVSPSDAVGATKDVSGQQVGNEMPRIDSGVTTSTTTSDAVTSIATNYLRCDDTKTDDLLSLMANATMGLPSVGCTTVMDDQHDDDSEDSSMKNSIGVERISDASNIKDSGLCPWVDRTEESSHHQSSMRRTGWLVMKTVLVQKNGKVAEAGKRKWKQYWATLARTSLLMYQCDNVKQLTENIQPTARIDVTGALAQSIHEYLKRDFVFCLTISSGYAFYLQAINQTETDSWIRAIHCVSATTAVECSDLKEIPEALKTQIQKLEEDIESEIKMKKLAELQLSTVAKPAMRSTISCQIKAWTENIERLNVDLYRLKCYLSSVQETELPNPQMALANVSKATKVALGRLHQGFTVSSLYAIVCAKRAMQTGMKIPKDPLTPRMLRAKGSKGHFLKSSESSGLMNLTFSRLSSGSKESPSEDQSQPVISVGLATRRQSIDHAVSSSESDAAAEVPAFQPSWNSQSNLVRVKLPDKQYAVMSLSGLTPMRILENMQTKQHINSDEHFVILRRHVHGVLETDIPEDESFLQGKVFDEVEVLQKVMHTVSLTKASEISFGFIAEAEIWETTSPSNYGCIVISQVDSGGLAEFYGLVEGDEVVSVNGALVQEIGLSAALQMIEDANLGIALSLTLRSKRVDAPCVSTNDNIISQLIIPAPPSQEELTDDALKGLLVPKPAALVEIEEDKLLVQVSESSDSEMIELDRQLSSPPLDQTTTDEEDFLLPELSREQIDVLLKNTDELTKFVRSLHAYSSSSIPSTKKMTREEKLHKCVAELVDTERTYVKNLNILLQRYLQPMKAESFLKKKDLNALFGNLEEIIPFQSEFLESLEEGTSVPAGPTADVSVRNIAFSIAGTFLYYAENFKLYSAFCASHTRAHQVLNRDDPQLHAFLDARNPKKELSSSLASLLILPIQRVLKYPLFLKEMHKLTDEGSSERELLWDAIMSVETVANYINEVQRVYDCYHTLFETTLKESNFKEPGVHVTIDELVHQCSVMWLNPMDDMLKGWKKGLGPEMNCFVFQTVVVLLVADKDRKGKKMNRVLSVSQEDFRYRKLLLASQTTLEDLADSDGVTNMWKLVHQEPCSRTRTAFIFRSSSVEDKSAVLIHLQKVISERRVAIERMVSALTPARRKRSSSALSSTSSPQLSLMRETSDSDVSSVDSWSSATGTGNVMLSPLRQFRPDTEVLPEENESYTDC